MAPQAKPVYGRVIDICCDEEKLMEEEEEDSDDEEECDLLIPKNTLHLKKTK